MLDHLAPIFRDLYETTGINFVFLYDEFEFRHLVDGMTTSLELMVACVTLSVVIGIIGAWAQNAHSRIVRMFVAAYIQFFRNTPPFVQLLFFYFGLGTLTPQVDMGGYYEPVVSAFGWAVVSLGCFGGAFNVEIFRSGIDAVPETTKEAADALGYTRLQSYRYVVLPLAIRVCLPALNTNLISLIKTTSLAYAISVPEITYTANQIWSNNINVAEMMLVLFLFYNIVVAVFAFGIHRLERSLSLPGYGR
ncbi:amino acid ABC transporter permease [Mesorhizobium sp. A623]